MSPFWASLFEDLRGRGRNASLFIFVLPTLVLLACLATQLWRDAWLDYVLPVAAVMAMFAVVWLGKTIQNARVRRRDRLKRSSLSEDELNKARARLVKHRSPQPNTNRLPVA